MLCIEGRLLNKDVKNRKKSSPYERTFSTWLKSTSTGVERPKICTDNLNLPFWRSISSMVPLNEANGPDVMRTSSPTEKSCLGLKVFSSGSSPIRTRIFLCSSCESGFGGFLPVGSAVKKPETPLMPTILDSTEFQPISGNWSSTKIYPGRIFLSSILSSPFSFFTLTFSVGTLTPVPML